ncbi:hypothetical protein VMT65_22890 [Nocardia sp. CDC153]|uniref:hypothetical protein n=1 Tax=Nocardia sp. CDC153 TaxID=3112167 RepID=UPI002DBFAEF2|nr:hypothetical protein [Nocardia sp. CDC153]MEC3955899.1 hypothetical protein [Nocardia sp. CDC153]
MGVTMFRERDRTGRKKGPLLRARLETAHGPLVAAQSIAALGTVGNQAVSSFLLVTTVAVV